MERKVALITGITGQDGSFLAEFLLEKGYDVHGTIRRSSVDFRERIAHLEGQPKFHLHYADLGDSMSILQVVSKATFIPPATTVGEISPTCWILSNACTIPITVRHYSRAI